MKAGIVTHRGRPMARGGVAWGEGAAFVDLPALRRVDALVHVVRAFESDLAPHPEGSMPRGGDVEARGQGVRVQYGDVVNFRLAV
jgi:hypothetical protein